MRPMPSPSSAPGGARPRQRARKVFASLSLCSLAGGSAGCATVTQEDPPSRLGAAGSNAEPAAGSGAGGGPAAPPPGAVPNRSTTAPAGSTQSTGGSATAPEAPAAAAGAPEIAIRPDAALEAPSGALLLEDDFENFDTARWFPSAGSEWQIQSDDARGSTVYAQTELESSGPHLSSAGDAGWRNVIVEADLQILDFNGSSSSYMAGVCVRVRDPENFYLVGVRSNDGKVGLRRYAGGGTNLVQSSFEEGTAGVWYRLRVEVIDSTISAYLDDALMFSESDATHETGGIGLCTVRASALFDNVSVTAP